MLSTKEWGIGEEDVPCQSYLPRGLKVDAKSGAQLPTPMSLASGLDRCKLTSVLLPFLSSGLVLAQREGNCLKV